MATKTLRIFEAVQPFSFKGRVYRAGSTVVEGHAILKGRANLFRPFQPTLGSLRVETDAPAEPPAEAPE